MIWYSCNGSQIDQTELYNETAELNLYAAPEIVRNAQAKKRFSLSFPFVCITESETWEKSRRPWHKGRIYARV